MQIKEKWNKSIEINQTIEIKCDIYVREIGDGIIWLSVVVIRIDVSSYVTKYWYKDLTK